MKNKEILSDFESSEIEDLCSAMYNDDSMCDYVKEISEEIDESEADKLEYVPSMEELKIKTKMLYLMKKEESSNKIFNKKFINEFSSEDAQKEQALQNLMGELIVPKNSNFIKNGKMDVEQFFKEYSQFHILMESACQKTFSRGIESDKNVIFYQLIDKIKKKLRYFFVADIKNYFEFTSREEEEKYNNFIWKFFQEFYKTYSIIKNAKVIFGVYLSTFTENIVYVFEEVLLSFSEKHITIMIKHPLEFIVNKSSLWSKSRAIEEFLRCQYTEDALFAAIAKDVDETSADILFMESSNEFNNFRSPWSLGLRGLGKLFCLIDFSNIKNPKSITVDNMFGKAIMTSNKLNLNDLDDVCYVYRAVIERLSDDEKLKFIKTLQKCEAFQKKNFEDLAANYSYSFDMILEHAWSYNDMNSVWALFFKEIVKVGAVKKKSHKYSSLLRAVRLYDSFWNSPAWKNAESLRIPSKYNFDAYDNNVLTFMLDWLESKDMVTQQDLNVLFKLCADNDNLLEKISFSFNDSIVARIKNCASKAKLINHLYVTDSLESVEMKRVGWLEKLRGTQQKVTKTKNGMLYIPEGKVSDVVIKQSIQNTVPKKNEVELSCGWKCVFDGVSESNIVLIKQLSDAVLSAREFVSLYPSLSDDEGFIQGRIDVYWLDVMETFHKERIRLDNVRKFSTINVEMNPNDTLTQNLSVLRAELQALVDSIAERVAKDSSFELKKMELYMSERFSHNVNRES